VDEVEFRTGPFAPEFLLQPTSVTALQGATVVLRTVVAGGPAPILQWYRNGASLGNAGTNSSLTLSNLAPAQSGSYHVTASNALLATNSTLVEVNVLPVPPVNNNFAARSPLPPGVEVSGYDFGATIEPGEPNHANRFPNYTVWWKWTAPATGPYALLSQSRGINVELIAAVYTGTALNNLTPVAGASQNAVLTNGVYLASNDLLFNATAGTEYSIVLGHNFGQSGYLTLQLVPSVPALNDHFADRIFVTGPSVTVFGDNRTATLEPGEPDAGLNSVWWAWTAPRSGMAIASWAGSSFAPLVSIYRGSTLLALISLTNAIPDGTEAIRFPVAAGEVYAISVASTSQGGDIVLNLASVAPSFTARFESGTGEPVLALAGPAGLEYHLQMSTNLITWRAIATNTFPLDGIVLLPVDPLTNSGRFYRVLLP
jgi:hypothetical protein